MSVPVPDPVFLDPSFQSQEPQASIFRLLTDLSAEDWQVVELKTHAHQQALGALLIADGIEVLEANEPWRPGEPPPSRCTARLKVDGVRWQGHLRAARPADVVKVRGFVLQCVAGVPAADGATSDGTPPLEWRERMTPAEIADLLGTDPDATRQKLVRLNEDRLCRVADPDDRRAVVYRTGPIRADMEQWAAGRKRP
jgi:hypothetical protein